MSDLKSWTSYFPLKSLFYNAFSLLQPKFQRVLYVVRSKGPPFDSDFAGLSAFTSCLATCGHIKYQLSVLRVREELSALSNDENASSI